MNKTKRKLKYKFWTAFVLLILCFSIVFNNKETVTVCHALASWTPSGGFQPGISATLPGTTIPDNITVTPLPFVKSGADSDINEDTTGRIYARDYLLVENTAKNSKWGDYKYLSYIDYLKIERKDGRKIYSASEYYNEDYDIVNYKAYLWLRHTKMESNNSGFLWTTQRAKWERASYYLTFYSDGCSDDSWEWEVVNQLGVSGVNPSDSTILLGSLNKGDESIPYTNGFFSTVEFYGVGYWHNEFWGNTWNKQTINATITPKINNHWRDWNNSLVPQNSKIVSAQRDGVTEYYGAKPYIVISKNLNNYVKVNDTKMTPNVDANVNAYYDGFHVGIVNNGKTKVSIEDGAKEIYTDYNCIVDQDIPDVNLVYLNANALDLAKESSVSTDSDGIKSQTLSGAIFKDQLQINFGATENESPERCYVTHNGVTKEITSGTWLKEAGNYTIVVKDLVGHTKTIKCSIDNTSPNQNIDRIQGQDYKVSKWYLASIPSDFIGHGTYSYLTYNEALNKAIECEKANLVTTYELDDVNNFHNTHLVANGDTVKVGKYWYYKSIDSPSLYVYYFTEDLLNKAIEKYAKNYVSSAQYFNYKSDIYPNDYGTIIDKDIYHNLWNESKTPAYISNDFVFRKVNDNESYKIYYKNIDNGQTNWSELIYNKSFKEQVNSHGLYLIKEIDYVGHETYCYVFLDLQAPMLDVTAKIYGSNDSFNHTISKNDIPANNELIFYYEDFVINKIIDDDTWYVLQVKCPNGKVLRYTCVDTLPNFDELGTGEYQITTYDRIGNNFTFILCLLGKAPKVKFETINANEQLKISITSGEQFNEITDLKIYRNDVLLNSKLGYDEYPNDDSNELIFISNSIKQYLFNKGGLYKVEITDNFGRTTSHEFKFEKDLPVGVLKGVKHNGRTNKDVEFIFNSTKYTAVAYENGNPIFPPSTLNDANILTTLTFSASDKDRKSVV